MVLTTRMLLEWTHPSQRDHGLGFLISQYKKIREEQEGTTDTGVSSNPKPISMIREEQMRALKAHYNKGLELSLLETDTLGTLDTVAASVTGHKRKAGDRDSDGDDDSETDDSETSDSGGEGSGSDSEDSDFEDSDFEESDSESDSDGDYEPVHKATKIAIRKNLVSDLCSSLLRPENTVRGSRCKNDRFGSDIQ